MKNKVKEWIHSFQNNRRFSEIKRLGMDRENLLKYYENLSLVQLEDLYKQLLSWLETVDKFSPEKKKKILLDLQLHLTLTRWFINYHQNR